MRFHTLLLSVCLAACAADEVPETMSKEEIAALGGKSDHVDFCGWNGDGICDEFCPSPDPDCDPDLVECKKTGCSGQVCSTEDIFTTCEWLPWYACYQSAICEAQADGSCGFTDTPELQQCLDDIFGQADEWLVYSPTQCGTNPWEMEPPVSTPGWPVGELGVIASYYSGIGIEIQEIGLLDPAQPIAVCLSCGCPRGDQLMVRASGMDAALLKQLGFQPAPEDALGVAPVQCGGNAWDGMSGATDNDRLVAWASSLGAAISDLGSVVSVEPMAVCAACTCPRGDTMVAIPATAADTQKLESAGFEQLD